MPHKQRPPSGAYDAVSGFFKFPPRLQGGVAHHSGCGATAHGLARRSWPRRMTNLGNRVAATASTQRQQNTCKAHPRVHARLHAAAKQHQKVQQLPGTPAHSGQPPSTAQCRAAGRRGRGAWWGLALIIPDQCDIRGAVWGRSSTHSTQGNRRISNPRLGGSKSCIDIPDQVYPPHFTRFKLVPDHHTYQLAPLCM